jgi:TrmH family RNA methyltransferase
LITSISNERIKNIRKLRQRKYREETGSFFIEGSRIVIEALQQKAEVHELLYTPNYLESEIGKQVLALAEKEKINYLELSGEVFQTISQKENPQGIGAVVRQRWNELSNPSGVWVGLSEIADPGNLGTIIRTCDATGAKGVILIGNCTDPYDPTALRASMGGIFTKELVKIEEDKFIHWVTESKIAVIGTSDAAECDYRTCRYPMNMILLMGSEREGLSEGLQQICRETVSMPMKGSCDSLNLAVATGVMLYEILYQHDKKRI